MRVIFTITRGMGVTRNSLVVVDVPDDVGLAPVVVFFLEEVIPPRNVERVVVLHVRGTVVVDTSILLHTCIAKGVQIATGKARFFCCPGVYVEILGHVKIEVLFTIPFVAATLREIITGYIVTR